ncbi:HAMP domain-containing histidine kinase [Nostocaceae cyanobacterium CENA369]|uniref:histidine kinase n=2 Tax=Dendronalium TaxID=2840442 RepID=A0A8J7LFL5_9NOST|nr:HAMP domain-containing sensor histidine kinase [Dendronalium phyllosphericum]MBH8572109.1 HAMP domain-containing histidine kinase [Dendronalium phyllosphericum CENA369]
MDSLIDNPGIGLKLLKNLSPQSEKGTPQYYTQKLKHFLQLQIDQLAAQPQIQWTRVVYQDPQMSSQQVLEASQMPFAFAKETLAYLQREGWLTSVSSALALKPIDSETIEKGFYYCHFGESSQSNQYLLLFANGPLSHTHRQFIKRTAASIGEYLDEHQQNWQHRQKIQILEHLIQRVGHQLRHPLGLINLYAHNLSRLLPTSKEQEQASVICQTARGLNQTLTEIMQSASSKKLQIVPQDLRSLVYKTLEDFQGWISEKDIQVCCTDRSLTLKVDPLQIKQAIANLLSNAIHFSPQGATIFIDWQEQQGDVLLTLRDEGPGLSSEDLQKLFEPFYTRRSEGTGLGLAIAQKIVLDHGGKLWARNAPQKGAEFSISLPRLISSIDLSKENAAC